MVKFEDGEIKDIVPYNLLSSEVHSISYAIGQEIRLLKQYSTASTLYAAITQVPDQVLDLIALELNTQYYEQSLPRRTREGLVSQTLKWYMHAGTASVIIELLKTVLDGGHIEEWYEYGGKPCCFKAYALTGNHEIPLGYGAEIKRRIEIYKNVRSWLEYFMFITQIEYEVRTAYWNAVAFSTKFYPMGEIPLKLDGKWKLNRKRKLSRFEMDSNRYPSTLDLILPVVTTTELSNQMDLKIGTEPTTHTRVFTEFKQSCNMSIKTTKCLTISTETEFKAGLSGIGITVINRLDGKWKLNQSRTLNGGLYLR